MEHKNRRVDEWLDTALKQYGVGEPRQGLENRILTQLRESERTAAPSFAWRPVLAALAVAVVIAAVLFRPNNHPATPRTSVANHESISGAGVEPRKSATSSIPVSRPAARVRPARHLAAASTPRLAQFPSPRPLSEQEQLLARYVERFPHEATLMARAQTESLREEALYREAARKGLRNNPKEQNQ